MGASFIAYCKMKDTSMGYGTVHVIRSCLLKMLDSIKGTSYAERFEILTEKNHRMKTEDIVSEWKKFARDLFEDCRSEYRLYGIYLFVNHSDCDGTFSGDDCSEIAASLRMLLDSDIDLSYAECAIENLYDVFSEVDSDGLVEIC